MTDETRVEHFPAWVPVGERMPEADKFVFAFVDDGNGRTRRIRAKWIPKLTIESSGGEADEFPEYNEADDTYYTPEGWYECNEYEETNWHVDDPVTHWMPLPPAPGVVTSNVELTCDQCENASHHPQAKAGDVCDRFGCDGKLRAGSVPVGRIPPEPGLTPAAKYPDLWEYHIAPSGAGPHAGNWKDKPHRLIYDLTRLAAEARDNAPKMDVPRWRHKKRGTTYTEVCRAQLQAATPAPEGHVLIVYRADEDGRYWARPSGEFLDGRFERVDNAPKGRIP